MKKIITLLIFISCTLFTHAQDLRNSSGMHAYVTGISVYGINAPTDYEFTKAGMMDPLPDNPSEGDLRNTENITNIRIFPNPLMYDFTLQLPSGGLYNVSIISPKGKVVMDEIDLHDQVRINCQELSPGDYYVRISDNNGVVSKRIIKQ